MKALLVFPRYAEALWTYKYAREFMGKVASSPPLGLLTIAALLPKAWPKQFIDLNVQSLSEHILNDAEVVFIGAMLAQQASALDLISRCKQAGKKIIAGGPLFCPELVAKGLFDYVDHIVIGEAEEILPVLLTDLEKGCAKQVYHAEHFPDITQIPTPLWSLVNLKDYAVVNLQFVRGCPYKCEFCYGNILNGNLPRAKTTAQIHKELEALYQYGWRGMVFVCDDNLVGNKHQARTQVLPAIASWMKSHHYPFSFMGAASVDLANHPDLMDLLVRAGFESVTLGIESPYDQNLLEMNKGQNRHVDMRAAVRTIQQHGLEVVAGMILGFDHDPPEIFQVQVDFIQQCGITNALVSLLFAFPDTPLYNRLKREGRLIDYQVSECVVGAINFIPCMPVNVLLDGYKQVLRYLYSPEGYYARLANFLKQYSPAWRRVHLQPGMMLKIVKAFYFMGVMDAYRGVFWHLLWTAIRKGKDAPIAFLRLAIQGYFMRREIEEFISDTRLPSAAKLLPSRDGVSSHLDQRA